MSVAANTIITDEERHVEERVEAARGWTPKEKARLARQTIVMVREVLAELEWRQGVFSDMHDDLYPRCGGDCDRGGGCWGDGREGGCRADELAGHDRLLMELASLAGLRELLDEAEDLPEPDDDLWMQLERRLAKASRCPSAWVALRAKLRREDSQTAASPPPASDDALAPRLSRREPLSPTEFNALEEKSFDATVYVLSDILTSSVGEDFERRVQRAEAILAAARAEKGAREDVAGTEGRRHDGGSRS